MCAEMDPHGDDNGDHNEPIKKNSPFNASNGETQFFDSQSWSPEFLGGGMEIGDGDELLQSTMPLEDTVMVEDAFETQIVDLAGETQVMDFGGETQVMDFGGETQAVNICGETQVLDDAYCFENMDIRLSDDFRNEDVSDNDGQGSDTTEVLGDQDDLVDDQLVREGGCQSVDSIDKEKGQCFAECKDNEKLIEQPNASSDQQNNAGLPVPTATAVPQSPVAPKSGSMRFTLVRAASLRASGLAARNTALKGTKALSSSIPTCNLSSEKFGACVTTNAPSAMELGKEGDQEQDVGRNNGIVNGLRGDNMCKGSNMAVRKLFAKDLDSEKKELPYDSNIDGGEDLIKLSASDQAGLSYVESQEPGDLSQANALEFVDRFIKESAAEFDREIECGSTGGKSKCISSINGPQQLAKKANEKSMVEELGIYDWDDNREDERGGEIFQRRKEDFFGGGSIGRRPSKPGINGLKELKDCKQLVGNEKRMDMFHSDSKLVLNNRKVVKNVNEAERKFRRNLINELDKESNVDFQDKQLENNATKADAPEMLDVGFDTQMAAEAMEALLHGEDTDNRDANDACQGVKKSYSSYKCSKQLSSRKRACLSDVGYASGHSMKTRTAAVLSNNVCSVSSDIQSTNARKQGEVVLGIKKSGNSMKISRENIKKRKAGSLERGINYMGRYDYTDKKVGNLEPVAHRTRRSARNKKSGAEASTRLASGDAQLQKTKNIDRKLDEEFEKMEAFTGRDKNDEPSVPRRRRSSRNLSRQVNKSDNIDDPPEPSVLPEDGQTSSRQKRSCRETQSSVCAQPADAQSVRSSARLDESPREKSKPSDSPCTPSNCKVPVGEISPVCMGNEYFNQSRQRSLSKFLWREIQSSAAGPQPISPSKDLRKRREITDVRVLYSNHLDEDVVKRQKKILARLGVSVASSVTDATHFIADQFVRTRNMLEAIASGKPVVTHLWIESCGQANSFIDEKNYILRDAKKEKEFGFSMPASLTCASQNPLLQGFKVLVTQNTKPGKEIISSLVKAVQGQAVERVGRSALKDGGLPDDLLILSCEEDYGICVPFLEKGATIYSSELLLNGIVTQKLEYERYRLFTDHLRITRSTIRLKLKKDGNKFLPVTKSKRH